MKEYTEVLGWGANHFGQLGIKQQGKHPVPKCYSFNVKISKVSCGEEHALFLSAEGNVYGMGSNNEKQLGINQDQGILASPAVIEDLISHKVVEISSGMAHNIALTSKGKVFCWGRGDFGNLGNGTNQSLATPTLVKLDEKIIFVNAGGNHTAAVTREGKAFVWGQGESGQLGLGLRSEEYFPVKLCIDQKVAEVVCGVSHSLILTQDSKVFATGANSNGQLGIGNRKHCLYPARVPLHTKVVNLSCYEYSGCIDAEGNLYIWGVEGKLVPTVVSFGLEVKELSLGKSYVCCIDSNGRAWTWGLNSSGELGLSDFERRESPCLVEPLKRKPLKKVVCGKNFTLALGQNVKEPHNFARTNFEKALKSERNQKPTKLFFESEVSRVQPNSERHPRKPKKVVPIQTDLVVPSPPKKMCHTTRNRSTRTGHSKEDQLENLKKQVRHYKKKLKIKDNQVKIEQMKNNELSERLKSANEEISCLKQRLEQVKGLRENHFDQENIKVYEKKFCSKSDNSNPFFRSSILSCEFLDQEPEESKPNLMDALHQQDTTIRHLTSLLHSCEQRISCLEQNSHIQDSPERAKLGLDSAVRLSAHDTMNMESPVSGIRSLSPILPGNPEQTSMHVEMVQDEYAPPTFRAGVTDSATLRNSLAEIKAKLIDLQDNKTFLQNKMETT